MFDIENLAAAPRGYANAADVAVGSSVDRLVDGTAGAHVEITVEVADAAFGKGGGEAYVALQWAGEITLRQLLCGSVVVCR